MLTSFVWGILSLDLLLPCFGLCFKNHNGLEPVLENRILLACGHNASANIIILSLNCNFRATFRLDSLKDWDTRFQTVEKMTPHWTAWCTLHIWPPTCFQDSRHKIRQILGAVVMVLHAKGCGVAHSLFLLICRANSSWETLWLLCSCWQVLFLLVPSNMQGISCRLLLGCQHSFQSVVEVIVFDTFPVWKSRQSFKASLSRKSQMSGCQRVFLGSGVENL